MRPIKLTKILAERINALRSEAVAGGDYAMALDCTRALAGSDRAVARCLRAMAEQLEVREWDGVAGHWVICRDANRRRHAISRHLREASGDYGERQWLYRYLIERR